MILTRFRCLSIVLLMLGGLVFAGWFVMQSGNHLADRVSIEAIRALQVGMTEEEILSIIGEPFDITHSSVDPFIMTFTYSKRVPFARWYPMLWVHFQDGKVIEVYAKRYFWGDDIGIYAVEINGSWETPLFEQSFPSARNSQSQK